MHLRTPGIRRRTRAGRRRGFTLIELLLAIVVVGTLATLAISSYSSYMDQVRVSQAEQDLTSIEARIELYEVNYHALPTSLDQVGEGSLLDPWGHPYHYLDFTGLQGTGAMRKDRNLVPINSDYDLYSAGKDGETLPPILAPVSLDDVIRANNGGYVGLASDY
ncbi:MAG TPA: prepilin-type N-terminal cleavage/methylation domain-containing protein [Steroidobacteraceae bacterium]|nr:prepilin-type N-terminal cleavage/methylation domain-containing protein [Steroidobacteraceae bacterium]